MCPHLYCCKEVCNSISNFFTFGVTLDTYSAMLLSIFNRWHSKRDPARPGILWPWWLAKKQRVRIVVTRPNDLAMMVLHLIDRIPTSSPGRPLHCPYTSSLHACITRLWVGAASCLISNNLVIKHKVFCHHAAWKLTKIMAKVRCIPNFFKSEPIILR